MGTPATRLAGSDRVEVVGWCLLLLPGLLYCGWRHATRTKVCPACGSDALMRESRAAAARRGPVVACARKSGDASAAWPRGFGSTRQRLRIGGVAAVPVVVAACAALLGGLDPAAARPIAHALWSSALLCGAWTVHQIQLAARRQPAPAQVAAWDARGRSLRIEPV